MPFPENSKGQVKKPTVSQLPCTFVRFTPETTYLLLTPPVSLTSLLSTERTAINQTLQILLTSSTRAKTVCLTVKEICNEFQSLCTNHSVDLLAKTALLEMTKDSDLACHKTKNKNVTYKHILKHGS